MIRLDPRGMPHAYSTDEWVVLGVTTEPGLIWDIELTRIDMCHIDLNFWKYTDHHEQDHVIVRTYHMFDYPGYIVPEDHVTRELVPSEALTSLAIHRSMDTYICMYSTDPLV
jgi:hypothetical protein